MLSRRARLRSRTPLRRSKPMRGPSKKRSRYRPRPRDTERMLWIRTLPCCAPQPHVCEWHIEAHHAGKKPGLRMKAPDDTCIPLCLLAHRQCETFSGPFRDFDGEAMRAWQDAQIAHYRDLWEQRQQRRGDQESALLQA
jgi:hypothetical protein